MWMNIPLSVSGWENVSPALRNATVVHLKVNLDPERAQLMQSIDATLQRVYRGRKNKAHTYFQNVGGLTDILRALANPPPPPGSDITRIETFRKANTDRQGVFTSFAVKQQYNALLHEISQQTQASSEASGLTPKDTQICFEKILGVR
ncbi:hypothetical protein Lser_V15G18716 [Lactuca serriola]